MPPLRVQRKARVCCRLAELPTTLPESLMAKARLETSPGRVPRPCISPSDAQNTAWTPAGPLEYPAASLCLLIPNASLPVSPGSVPRFTISPLGFLRKARKAFAPFAEPTMAPSSLIPRLVLQSVPGKSLIPGSNPVRDRLNARCPPPIVAAPPTISSAEFRPRTTKAFPSSRAPKSTTSYI